MPPYHRLTQLSRPISTQTLNVVILSEAKDPRISPLLTTEFGTTLAESGSTLVSAALRIHPTCSDDCLEIPNHYVRPLVPGSHGDPFVVRAESDYITPQAWL